MALFFEDLFFGEIAWGPSSYHGGTGCHQSRDLYKKPYPKGFPKTNR